jgi:chromosome 01 contig 1, DNA sequence (fragment)
MTKTKKNISTRRKVAAAIAATTIATGTFAPLIAEELDPTPAATATTEAGDTATTSDDTPTNTGGALAPHLTSGDLIYSSEIDAHFRVDNAQAGNDSTYTDLTVTNDSSVASNLTWASLDTLRTFLPEGATFGSPAGKSGEIVKGSDLITNNIAEATQVDPEKDYWFMGKIPSSGEVRISVVKKEEPKEEPTPAPETPAPSTDPTPTPDNTGEPTPAPETPAPDATNNPAPAPDTKTDTPTVENTAETIDKNYKAPAETEIPKDNATRHDSAGRVVSTAPVTTINTDAQAGTTTTRFEDGGEVTTNTNTGEVLESTLGTTVTTTGTTINSTPTKKTTPTAKTTNTSNTVKGQTLRTGDAGVATITTAPAAAMPLIATGLSLALAGTLVATNAHTNRRKKEN